MTTPRDHRNSGLAKMGASLSRHPFRAIVAWLIITVVGFGLAAGVVGEGLFPRLHSGAITVSGQSEAGFDALTETGTGDDSGPTYIMVASGADITSPASLAAAIKATQQIMDVPHVKSVAMPWTVPGGLQGPASAAFLKDGQASSGGYAVVVTFDDATTDTILEEQIPAVDAALDVLVTDTGADSNLRGGFRQLVDAILEQIETDLTVGEGLALPVTFVVMVIVFGGFLAAGMPIAGAIASIAGALGTLLGFSYVIELDATVVNIVTVMGLAISIDYGLLIVSRYREELRKIAKGRPAKELTNDDLVTAGALTLDRAGRTVFFSGLTVAIAMSGMLLFEADIFKAIASAGMSVVLIAMTASLTLVPALCRIGGRRLLRGRTEEASEHGVFSKLAHGVQRMPWLVIAAVTAILVVMAIPTLSMKLTSSGEALLPVGAPQRTLFETLRTDYPLLSAPDIYVIAKPGANEADVAAWATDVAANLEGVERVDAPVARGDLYMVGLHTVGGSVSDDARRVTNELRGDKSPPFPSYISGQASGLVDFADAAKRSAPWAALLVIGATFILLFLMTGSVVVPIKALVMNTLSLGASLGAVVWIFQYGNLEGLLRFSSVGAVEEIIPVMVLAFGFGLSMDYEMFLLSRIVELHEQGRSTDEAVAIGLQRSGRIITSAALLMIIVMMGFVFAQVLVIKETGLALVLAIALDATLVRMLLVPATMTVLGKANWWAPKPLRALHERFGITE